MVDNIKKMEFEREERRKKFEEAKIAKADRAAANAAAGKNLDIDFDLMIQQAKSKAKPPLQHIEAKQMKICVCVRKRPLSQKEENDGEIDCVSSNNPQTVVHEPKIKVDGITKYIQNHDFVFDNCYSEVETSQDVYNY